MQQQQLSGRRRGNQRSVNSPARKTYASENDVPLEPSSGNFFPFTPHKLTASNNISAPAGSQPFPSKQQQKSRSANKPRSKNPSASPGPALYGQGRDTPPQSGHAKSLVAAAFAGATFHASPAPSSLPIPSFFAKALDSPGLKDSGRVSQEPSPPATDSEAPTPQHRTLAEDRVICREESPLDVFFRADRAEKEKARRASSANVLAVLDPGPFSPPTERISPQEPRTVPNGMNSYRRRPTTQRSSSTGISSSELDGTPGMAMGPAFSTPYQERLRAATRLSSDKQPSTTPRVNGLQKGPQPQAKRYDMTEQLKQYLAIAQDQASSHPLPTSPQPAPQTAPQPAPQTVPQPVLQPVLPPPQPPQYRGAWVPPKPLQYFSAPSAPAMSAAPAAPAVGAPSNGVDGGRSQDILNMEDHLRRMLKIGSGSNLGAPPSK